MPPDDSGRHTHLLDTRKVAGETRRRNRKRTKRAKLTRRINAKAEERQRAWTTGGNPAEVATLSEELNGRERSMRPDGLFAAAREMDKGKLPQARPSRPTGQLLG